MYVIFSAINKSDKIIIKFDKTGSHYQIDVDAYYKAINKTFNKIYKKKPHNSENSFNSDAKKSASDLKIDCNIYKLYKQQAFITLKATRKISYTT